MHDNLTVFRNLYYSAQLRLPAAAAAKDKLELVQHVIKVLGMEKIQNSVVGGAEKRGISGGQKRRVTVGVELVTQPSVLFLDEPTTGPAAEAWCRCKYGPYRRRRADRGRYADTVASAVVHAAESVSQPGNCRRKHGGEQCWERAAARYCWDCF